MKKSSKKKIKKNTKKAFRFLGLTGWRATKATAKGIGKLGSLTYKKIKSSSQKAKENKLQKKEAKRAEKLKITRKTKAKFQEPEQIRKHKGSLEKFTSLLHKNKSSIGIILGARGTGKSALGMHLLENFAAQTEKHIYAMGFKQDSLPEWVQVIKRLDEAQNDAILLVDEGGIEFSSRSSMSNANKLLSEILFIARHKDLSVLFITQNSSNLEINALRQADFLLLKPSSLLQVDFERKKIKDIYAEIKEEFEELQEEHEHGLTYVYADKFRGFMKNPLPSFWSEQVSKGYAKR